MEKIHNRAVTLSRTDILSQRLKPSVPRRSRCRHRPGPSRTTHSRPGVPAPDSGAPATPGLSSPRTRDLRPPPSPARHPRCPTWRRPGYRAAAALPGLGPGPWRLRLLSPRPAPASHSRHAPSSGRPRQCEDEPGVLGCSPRRAAAAGATGRVSWTSVAPSRQHAAKQPAPSRPGFLLLRRKRYLESSP